MFHTLGQFFLRSNLHVHLDLRITLDDVQIHSFKKAVHAVKDLKGLVEKTP